MSTGEEIIPYVQPSTADLLQEACRDACGGNWNGAAVQGMNASVKSSPSGSRQCRPRCIALGAEARAATTSVTAVRPASTAIPSGTRADLSQLGNYCTINSCDETTCPSGATCVRCFPVALLMMADRPARRVHCDPACGNIDCPADAGADRRRRDGRRGRRDRRPCGRARPTLVPRRARPTPVPRRARPTPVPMASATDARARGGAQPTPGRTAAAETTARDEVCLDVGLCAKRSYEQRECAKVCSSSSRLPQRLRLPRDRRARQHAAVHEPSWPRRSSARRTLPRLRLCSPKQRRGTRAPTTVDVRTSTVGYSSSLTLCTLLAAASVAGRRQGRRRRRQPQLRRRPTCWRCSCRASDPPRPRASSSTGRNIRFARSTSWCASRASGTRWCGICARTSP